MQRDGHFFRSGSEVEEDNGVGIQRIVHLVLVMMNI
jgi:hypothetical protein